MMNLSSAATGPRRRRSPKKFPLSPALVIIVAVVVAASTAHAIYIEGEGQQLRGKSNNDIDERDLQDATSKTFLVTFNDNSIAASKRCDALAKSHGGSVTSVYNTVLNGCSISVPNVGAQVSAQATFTALSNNPSVQSVEFDQIMYALQTPPSSLFAINDGGVLDVTSVSAAAVSTASTSWGLDRIDQCAPPLNNLMTKQDATGVTVFIIDTGIMNTHNELKSSMSADNCHVSYINGEPAFSDGNGHG
jgi:subtilisin family serine protease